MERRACLNKEQLFKIYDQMGKYVCLIDHDNCKATGFFCNIPFKDKKQYLPVLVTCNYAINENMIKENNVICISIFDKKEIRNIELKNRLMYTNREYNVTLIEIKPNIDKICNFLELDENIFEENKENIYKMKSVYVLQYSKGECSSVSFGIILEIKNDMIYHNCWTFKGSAGGPLLSMDNLKVIGLHKGKCFNKSYKIGKLLDSPINEFQKSF